MIDAHTVYVDDSGTDPMSKIVTAAFCVSTVERWLQFGIKWKKISQRAGFKHFHMTEFASCKQNTWCRDCRSGKTTLADHPWRNWPAKKRENVLNCLAKAIIAHVDCGVGLAITKQDYADHILNSPVRKLIAEPVGDEHFTYAVQRCGGELAKWRAANNSKVPLKFVFDLTTQKQRDEIATVFFGAAEGEVEDLPGVEKYFKPTGVSFESRRDVVQLLAADMLAWVSGKIRAAQLFGRGPLNPEAYQAGCLFVDSSNIKFGYSTKEVLQEWESNKLASAQHLEANESEEDGI